jgi:hypothetical protein
VCVAGGTENRAYATEERDLGRNATRWHSVHRVRASTVDVSITVSNRKLRELAKAYGARTDAEGLEPDGRTRRISKLLVALSGHSPHSCQLLGLALDLAPERVDACTGGIQARRLSQSASRSTVCKLSISAQPPSPRQRQRDSIPLHKVKGLS